MQRLTKSLFIIAFIFLFSLLKTANAQEEPLGQAFGLNMICLHAEEIDRSKHITDLSASGGLQYGKKVEIWRQIDQGGFECAVDKNKQSMCAPGFPTNPGKFYLTNVTTDQVVASLNGQLADTNGNTKIRAISSTAQNKNHTFYAVQEISEFDNTEAKLQALKLATFYPPTGIETSCKSIHWDPFGAIFDAVSLEPLPNVEVALYQDTVADKKLNLSQDALVPDGTPGVEKNPALMAADGQFSFIVPDGTYFLLPQKLTNHTYPVSTEAILNLRTRQNTYGRDQNGAITELYTGDPIEEFGTVEHRDIPVMPKNIAQPTTNPPTIQVSLNEQCIAGTCYQRAVGICSHPKCIVNVYSGSRKVGSQEVDDKRGFEIYIKNENIDQAVPLDFQGVKQSLWIGTSPYAINPPVGYNPIARLAHLFIGTVFAQESAGPITQVYPKPSYIEGIAYNQNLQAVPYAKVQIIIPQMNNRAVVTVSADKRGFVQIPHYLVPPVPFELVVWNQQGTQVQNKMTTASFTKANTKYLAENKVNLLQKPTRAALEASPAAKVEQQPDPSKIKFVDTGTTNTADQQGQGGTAADGSAQTTASNSILFALVSLVFIAILGGLGVFILRLRNKNTGINPPSGPSAPLA